MIRHGGGFVHAGEGDMESCVLHGHARQMLRVLVAAWAMLVAACASPPPVEADFRSCRASCVQAGHDGESCQAWAPSAAPACQLRFTAVASCCAADGRTMCATARPSAPGAPCVCRAADARGAFVVQGFSCRPS
jgi:hypothetical protein